MTNSESTISPFQYNPGSSPEVVTYLQGIKGGETDNGYLLVGANNSSGPNPVGLAYQGPLDAAQSNGVSGSGRWSIISVPERFEAAGTSVYGPDRLPGVDRVNYVGAFTRDTEGSPNPFDPAVVGFTYAGRSDGSTIRGWSSIQGITKSRQRATYTFVHSVDGGLAVGNADEADRDGRTGYFSLKSTAFLVDLQSGQQSFIRFPGDRNPLVTHTAYGIWQNNKRFYTIAGGSGSVLDSKDDKLAIGDGYLIDYDSITGRFFNYQTFSYNNEQDGADLITHFEGIYRDDDGAYHLPATSVDLNGDEELAIASVATIERDRSGAFKEAAEWNTLDIMKSGTDIESVFSTANSIYGDQVVGFANYPDGDGSVEPLSFVVDLS